MLFFLIVTRLQNSSLSQRDEKVTGGTTAHRQVLLWHCTDSCWQNRQVSEVYRVQYVDPPLTVLQAVGVVRRLPGEVVGVITLFQAHTPKGSLLDVTKCGGLSKFNGDENTLTG